MKVILINPSMNKQVYADYTDQAPILPPLGLLSIASIMQEFSDDIILIDMIAQKISIKELNQILKKEKPDILCLTSSTATVNNAKKIIVSAKKHNDSLISIMGGSHISLFPKETMKECSALDFGCIGESEETIKELFQSIKDKKGYEFISGLIYRKNKKSILNDKRKLIKDLDLLPIPAFELIKDINLYFHTGLRSKGIAFPLVTSRGCIYNCSFCDQGVFSMKWRAHNAEKVIEMIEKVRDLFHVDYISFEDDNFAISKTRVIEICKLLIKKKIKIKWGCSLHINNVHDDMLYWMKKAGCWSVYVGIESGTQRILNDMNKNITIERVFEKTKLIKKNKLKAYGSFIIGYPTETKEEIEQTIRLALKLPLDGASFFVFTPYPKTNIYNELIKDKIIPNDWNRFSAHNSKPIIVNKHLNEAYLLKKQKKAYTRFYLRPKFILKNMDRVFDLNFLMKVMKFLKELF